MLPGVVLFSRALIDVNLLDSNPLILWTLPIAGVTTFALARSSRSPDRLFLTIWFAFGAFYVFGLLTHANTLLDRSDADSFEVLVEDKRVSGGRNTTHYLLLEPWGPRSEAAEVPVTAGFYGSVAEGDTVCVSLLPGALNVPWYFVSSCEWPSGDSTP
jgi:hypothetical protein